MKPIAVLAVLALAACGYSPPPHTDTANPAYIAARDACEDSAAHEVNVRNAKTGLAWMTSPVRRWGQITDATGTCMNGKGFGQVRWCTPAELRAGTNTVVTSEGIQCFDPPGHPSDTAPPAPATPAKGGKRLLP